MSKVPRTFSIGYEKRDIRQFLDLLTRNRIELLVDVRANPVSRKPSFSKSGLANSLSKSGIGYLHMPSLGIESSMRKNLKTDADYAELFRYYRIHLSFRKEDVTELAKLGFRKRIALMCFERDHLHCHRGILAEVLERGYCLKVENL